MTDSASSIKQKISFTFAKTGAARFFSHHDIMRHFERGFKRAGIRVHHSKGFNPRPRMVFPHPLPLGVSSICEEIEVELSEEYSLEELFKLLVPVLKPCIELKGMTTLNNCKRGRVVESCTYLIENFPDQADLTAANREMLEAEQILVERGHGKKRREVEIRRFILSSEVAGNSVTVNLAHFTDGAGRADEVGQYLARKLNLDWHDLDFTKVAMNFKK